MNKKYWQEKCCSV